MKRYLATKLVALIPKTPPSGKLSRQDVAPASSIVCWDASTTDGCKHEPTFGGKPFLLLPSFRMVNTPPDTREEVAAEWPDSAFSLLS